MLGPSLGLPRIVGAFRVYMPEEDFEFVRGYIQSRISNS